MDVINIQMNETLIKKTLIIYVKYQASENGLFIFRLLTKSPAL